MSRLHSCERATFGILRFARSAAGTGILAGMTRAHLRTTVRDEPQRKRKEPGRGLVPRGVRNRTTRTRESHFDLSTLHKGPGRVYRTPVRSQFSQVCRVNVHTPIVSDGVSHEV